MNKLNVLSLQSSVSSQECGLRVLLRVYIYYTCPAPPIRCFVTNSLIRSVLRIDEARDDLPGFFIRCDRS